MTEDRPKPPGIRPAELKRQLVHASFGLVALALRWLTWPQALICAGAAVAHNLFLLPVVPWGKSLFRPGEPRFGGIVLYPLVVLVMVFALPLHLAAAAWMILAIGDGASNVCGRTLGVRKLPWNRQKSWAGSFGFIVFAAPAAWGALHFVAANPAVAQAPTLTQGFLLVLAAATTGSIAESLPLPLDDNVTVGAASGLTLGLLSALL